MFVLLITLATSFFGSLALLGYLGSLVIPDPGWQIALLVVPLVLLWMAASFAVIKSVFEWAMGWIDPYDEWG